MTLEEYIPTLPNPICVIGNGVILEQHGSKIDKYPTIIRINNFHIKGYERNVGSKTTVWCINGGDGVIKRKLNIDVICPFPINYHPKNRRRYPDNTIFATSDPDIVFTKKKPTVGSCLLMLFDKLKINTDIYGFDFLTSGHYWERNHIHRTKSHDAASEKQLITNSKYITIY